MTTPTFQTPSTNPFSLTNVGSSSAPVFADLDGDGDLDAFLGNRDGNTLYYRNTGNATAPAFAAPVTNPFSLTDVGLHAAPTFVDLDGDGDLDAFIGNFDGNTLYYQNTGSATAPAFVAPVTNPFGLTDVGSFAAPTLADLDGDGDLDAFVGNFDGNTLYYQNTGSATAPAFAAAVTNPFGLTDVGFSATPAFADLDRDGDLDAFVGNSAGNTLYYRNTGNATAPAFAAPVTNPFGLSDGGSFTDPTFADLDSDGDLDAFVGNSTGNTLFFENDPPPPATPALAAAVSNPFGLTNVGGNHRGTPTLADLDGDGDLDALAGNYDGDTVYYQNTGNATAPAFAAPVANPFGLTQGYLTNPAFADLDGDGDLDALVGQYDGNTRYFENTGSATAPAFAPPVANPFGLTDVGFHASPALADLDGDGDLDALVGDFEGNLRYYQNTGSVTAPAFAAPVTNPFGLTDVGYSASPEVADLDGDGDLDVLLGDGTGNMWYYQNTGSAIAPAFAAPVANPFGLTNLGAFTVNAPALADLDGDGILDVLVGTANGNLLYYQNTVCFLRGTRILTRAGYVPVQDLQPGDEVQTLGHGWRPLIWLGVRHVQPNALGRFDHAVLPIRIRPDAFGAGMPNRDLWVSPDHAVFFRHHLIPAKALVNGATVVRDAEVESIAYYHVLLDRHAVVFSDGLPTESYSPQENLDYFENLADCPAQWRHDATAPIGLFADCHPRVTQGAAVETARAFLARQAGSRAEAAEWRRAG